MADPRRRGGRGRSGRGGRIPRRGEGGPAVTSHDEAFVSFPRDVSGPIRVPSALDHAAIQAVFEETLRLERRQALALQALAERSRDPALGEVRVQVERHRDVLEQLARDVDARIEPASEGDGENAATDARSALAEQRLARVGWSALQAVAYASGDKRVDRVVKPVLREKERHVRVLEAYAATEAIRGLFAEPED